MSLLVNIINIMRHSLWRKVLQDNVFSGEYLRLKHSNYRELCQGKNDAPQRPAFARYGFRRVLRRIMGSRLCLGLVSSSQGLLLACPCVHIAGMKKINSLFTGAPLLIHIHRFSQTWSSVYV